MTTIPIFVNIRGDAHDYNVDPSATVETLTRQIFQLESIEQRYIRIYFRSILMEPELTFEDYNIMAESTLTAIISEDSCDEFLKQTAETDDFDELVEMVTEKFDENVKLIADIKSGALQPFTGPIKDHLSIVFHGKPGTAMAAFGKQLSEVDIAAVVTYERNAWNNKLGDMVTPQNVLTFKQAEEATQ